MEDRKNSPGLTNCNDAREAESSNELNALAESPMVSENEPGDPSVSIAFNTGASPTSAAGAAS
jgi:hypothetical protein